MTEDTGQDIANLSFEAAIEQLESIVRQLETGEAPLDESIALYERGDKLRAHCEARLKSARERIEKIKLDAGGEPVGVEPLDPQ
ncbi:MAG: exodeoxyribonuclease VII small subunit [Parasphingopyxis sp.]|uniref:exodeoxyribonuclease VII small subunit n=1 Tax=Parasphingopyxis sp. TaxID=1920299 RepID=UPI0026134EEC|nr:exodeoxyribonuclease VII small subunit [uncultured Parasphingopyxis sp.]